MNEFNEAKVIIETETGFHCFEDMPAQQHTFYGLSMQYEDFKAVATEYLRTGDLVVLMDTGESHFYSAFTKKFY